MRSSTVAGVVVHSVTKETVVACRSKHALGPNPSGLVRSSALVARPWPTKVHAQPGKSEPAERPLDTAKALPSETLPAKVSREVFGKIGHGHGSQRNSCRSGGECSVLDTD